MRLGRRNRRERESRIWKDGRRDNEITRRNRYDQADI